MKGTLSARDICNILEKVATSNSFFDSEGKQVEFQTTSHPLADGGDGSLEVIKETITLKTVKVKVHNALLKPIVAQYAVDKNNNAYIEMAAASGLVQLEPHERNCMHTSSFGFGELIKHAIKAGHKHIFLFLGGSATCDAGIGMATALGFRFKDHLGKPILPVGGQLKNIAKIETSDMLKEILNTEFTSLYDVTNSILGSKGAAPVFAPQKGANPDEVKFLDQGLEHLLDLVEDGATHSNLSKLKGGGAAGGMGFGTHYFLGAKLKSGAEEIMRLTHFLERIQYKEIVITAEGQLDITSLNGKITFGVFKVSKKVAIPCYAIVGNTMLSSAEEQQLGIENTFSLIDKAGTKAAISNAKTVLTQVAKDAFKHIAMATVK